MSYDYWRTRTYREEFGSRHVPPSSSPDVFNGKNTVATVFSVHAALHNTFHPWSNSCVVIVVINLCFPPHRKYKQQTPPVITRFGEDYVFGAFTSKKHQMRIYPNQKNLACNESSSRTMHESELSISGVCAISCMRLQFSALMFVIGYGHSQSQIHHLHSPLNFCLHPPPFLPSFIRIHRYLRELATDSVQRPIEVTLSTHTNQAAMSTKTSGTRKK